MYAQRRAVGPVLAALVVTALSACGVHPAAGETAPATGLLIVPAEQRPPAPDLRGRTLDGTPIALADQRGGLVLVNAYASWCAECLAELPVLAAADRTVPSLSILGLDVSDSPEAGRGVLDAVGARYPAIVDPHGDLLAQFTGTPTAGLPMSFLIDDQGRVAGRILGPATPDMLTDAVQRLR